MLFDPEDGVESGPVADAVATLGDLEVSDDLSQSATWPPVPSVVNRLPGATDPLNDQAQALLNRTEFLNKRVDFIEPRKILLRDFVKEEHAGDASLALADAIVAAKGHSSCTIDFEFYEYDFQTLLIASDLVNIKLNAADSVVKNSTGLAEVIQLTACKNVHVILNSVSGIETYERHIALGGVYHYFFRFISSYSCRVYGSYCKNIRSLVQFYDCIACKAYDNSVYGFMPDVDFGVTVTNANFVPLINFSGGRNNLAWGNHAENHGSDVLWQRASASVIAFANSGRNLQDNGVYGSSGDNSISFGNSFDYVRGSGVKPRGSGNIVVANTASNVEMGVSTTGNGLTPDSSGANGFGNITAFNAVSRSRAYAISVDVQDGYYSRGAVAAFNTVKEHLGTATLAPIRLNVVDGYMGVGNVIDSHSADYGMLLSSTASKATNKSGVLALNLTNSAAPLARSVYGQYGVHVGNLNIGGTGIQYRYQENTVASGNNALAVAVVDTPTYPCINMTYVSNGGVATNIGSAATAIIDGNKGTVMTISSSTKLPAPSRALQLAKDESTGAYISVASGGSLVWAKMTVTP